MSLSPLLLLFLTSVRQQLRGEGGVYSEVIAYQYGIKLCCLSSLYLFLFLHFQLFRHIAAKKPSAPSLVLYIIHPDSTALITVHHHISALKLTTMPKWEDIREDLFEAIMQVQPPINREQQADIVKIMRGKGHDMGWNAIRYVCLWLRSIFARVSGFSTACYLGPERVLFHGMVGCGRIFSGAEALFLLSPYNLLSNPVSFSFIIFLLNLFASHHCQH